MIVSKEILTVSLLFYSWCSFYIWFNAVSYYQLGGSCKKYFRCKKIYLWIIILFL